LPYFRTIFGIMSSVIVVEPFYFCGFFSHFLLWPPLSLPTAWELLPTFPFDYWET
jgi:hypothetical protein